MDCRGLDSNVSSTEINRLGPASSLLFKRLISVVSRIHANVFFRAFVDANMMKKRRQQVFHQLGGFSQQGAVSSILGKYVLLKVKCCEVLPNMKL